jgi:hypothetical protein
MKELEVIKEESLKKELREVLNKYSVENESNTPDFILAEYLRDCLKAFEKASNSRENWYGKHLTIEGWKKEEK